MNNQNVGFKKLAQEIEIELFQNLRGSQRPVYIFCCGEDGYKWFAKYSSRKNTPNRVGKYKSLLNVIEDALFDYVYILGKDVGTLLFLCYSFEQLKQEFTGITKNSLSGTILLKDVFTQS